MAAPKGVPESWSVDDVCDFLSSLQLHTVAETFKVNRVTGKDLVSLSEEELIDDLELTKFQARKVKRELAGLSSQPAPQSPANEPLIDLGDTPPPVAPEAALVRDLNNSFVRPKPAAVIDISDATIQQYEGALELIRQLEQDQVETKLAFAMQRLGQLQAQLKAADDALPKLKKEYDECASQVKKYEERKIKIEAMLQKKLARARDELRSAQSALDGATSVKRKAEDNIAKETATINYLREQVGKLKSARQYEVDVINSLFAGPAGDSKENALEAQYAQITPNLDQMRRMLLVYQQGETLLKSAQKKMAGAHRECGEALRLARADMAQNVFSPVPFQNGPIGFGIDVAKRQHVQQCNRLLQSGMEDVNHARSLVPNIPDADKIQVGTGAGMVMDLVFDNMITDMRVKQQLQQNMALIEKTCKQVDNATSWMSGWSVKLSGDTAALAAQQTAIKTELDAYRRQLFREVAKSKNNETI